MIKIEMLDDDGNVTEVAEAKEHRCSSDSCEEPAICEDCGVTGDKVAIFLWTSASGMDYFACGPCIDRDDYSRFAKAIKVRNPETGEEIAPHAASDGWPLDADGTRSLG